MFAASDTIVAIATAQQNAGVGIVRLSGPDSAKILQHIFYKTSGKPLIDLQPRYLYHGKIIDENQKTIDDCLAVWMPNPHSFTGEDVVEFQCHGNIHLLRLVVRRVLACIDRWPVRAAEPGEFTKRAYLNGKMDLTQAEAVHALIQSESEAAFRAHLANLDGALSRRIFALREELLTTLALVEASFEFSEEDIQTYDPKQVYALLLQVHNDVTELLSSYATAKLCEQGVSVAIIGRPNVGKSSLLNALLLEDRAIVTEIAGTTRDVIQGIKILGGLRFILNDTAGLRETKDVVESIGMQKSQDVAHKADIILWVTDDPLEDFSDFADKTVIRILNKADLHHIKQQQNLEKNFDVVLSATNRYNLPKLEARILEIFQDKNVHNYVHINERQRNLLSQAIDNINIVLKEWHTFSEVEILAEELRHVVFLLDDVIGKVSGDDVLGEIFQRFCIGK